MNKMTPGPTGQSADPASAAPPTADREHPLGHQPLPGALRHTATTHPVTQGDPSGVATWRAQVAFLTQQSDAVELSQPEHVREIQYALAHAYAQLGEALLGERESADAAHEGLAESAMSCFSDAATLFHGLGAETEKDQALRRARYAHELYSR